MPNFSLSHGYALLMDRKKLPQISVLVEIAAPKSFGNLHVLPRSQFPV